MSVKAVLFTLLFLPTTLLSSFGQTTPSKQDQIHQHAQLAQQYLKQQRPDLAIPELRALVALEPENVDAQEISAFCYSSAATMQGLFRTFAPLSKHSRTVEDSGPAGIGRRKTGRGRLKSP